MALALLALACVVPGGALAAPPERERPDPIPIFSVPASNGYKVIGVVNGNPELANHRLSLLVFDRRSFVGYSSFPATYHEETGAIAADMGALGEVDLRFRFAGGVRRASGPCGEEEESIEIPAGEFRGTVRFEGEEGFARASATRAKLDAEYLIGATCEKPGDEPEPSATGAVLRARARGGGDNILFEAVKNAPRRRIQFTATITEGSGSLRTFRAVESWAPSGRFEFPPGLGSARARPPAPFSGRARFTRGLAAPTWLGSLSIDFPGRAGVELAGGGFEPRLFPARRSR